jgi:hypothetical protein
MAFFKQNTTIRYYSTWQTTAQVIFTAFISLAAIIFAVQSVRSRSFSSRANALLTCGGLTPDERASRCRFDMMSLSWLPPPCYDSELSEEFASLRQWRYYSDNEGREEIPVEQVQKGLQDVYVPYEHHLHHCSYMWRKLHRAAIRGGPIDGYIADTRHTVHCGHELVEERGKNISLQEINTIIMVKTPTCMFYV